jgi:hypothetical protein
VPLNAAMPKRARADGPATSTWRQRALSHIQVSSKSPE